MSWCTVSAQLTWYVCAAYRIKVKNHFWHVCSRLCSAVMQGALSRIPASLTGCLLMHQWVFEPTDARGSGAVVCLAVWHGNSLALFRDEQGSAAGMAVCVTACATKMAAVGFDDRSCARKLTSDMI